MQRPPRSHSPRRNVRSLLGTGVAVLGATALALGLCAGPVSADVDTQTVALHNSTADTERDCPDGVNDYWHFVTAPNNGSFSFVSISLNLSGNTVTFSGGQIVPNGSQTDNVFVRVPAGYTLTSLQTTGSSAEISPDSGNVRFVLSHLCDGTGQPTTTTTVQPTTTTVRPTTTTVRPTTTTMQPTTTTMQPTTTTMQPTTTVEVTTTTIVDQEGPTTTAEATTTTIIGDDGPTTTVEATTTTIGDQFGPATTAGPTSTITGQVAPVTTMKIAQAPPTPGTNPGVAQLPSTGLDTGSLMVIGMVLLTLGGVMLLGTRRPADA